MLPQKQQNARPELKAHGAFELGTADSPQVHDLGGGGEKDLPAGLAKAVTPVRLLAIHEVALIEDPDLFERFAPLEEEFSTRHAVAAASGCASAKRTILSMAPSSTSVSEFNNRT
jgi:hypothetical protein